MNALLNKDEIDGTEKLISCIKKYISESRYKECENLLSYSMFLYPHAAEVHNLWGILLEKEGHHVMAMNHFRASLDLNPAYRPARINLEAFGSFLSDGMDFSYGQEEYTSKKF